MKETPTKRWHDYIITLKLTKDDHCKHDVDDLIAKHGLNQCYCCGAFTSIRADRSCNQCFFDETFRAKLEELTDRPCERCAKSKAIDRRLIDDKVVYFCEECFEAQ